MFASLDLDRKLGFTFQGSSPCPETPELSRGIVLQILSTKLHTSVPTILHVSLRYSTRPAVLAYGMWHPHLYQVLLSMLLLCLMLRTITNVK